MMRRRSMRGPQSAPTGQQHTPAAPGSPLSTPHGKFWSQPSGPAPTTAPNDVQPSDVTPSANPPAPVAPASGNPQLPLNGYAHRLQPPTVDRGPREQYDHDHDHDHDSNHGQPPIPFAHELLRQHQNRVRDAVRQRKRHTGARRRHPAAAKHSSARELRRRRSPRGHGAVPSPSSMHDVRRRGFARRHGQPGQPSPRARTRRAAAGSPAPAPAPTPSPRRANAPATSPHSTRSPKGHSRRRAPQPVAREPAGQGTGAVPTEPPVTPRTRRLMWSSEEAAVRHLEELRKELLNVKTFEPLKLASRSPTHAGQGGGLTSGHSTPRSRRKAATPKAGKRSPSSRARRGGVTPRGSMRRDTSPITVPTRDHVPSAAAQAVTPRSPVRPQRHDEASPRVPDMDAAQRPQQAPAPSSDGGTASGDTGGGANDEPAAASTGHRRGSDGSPKHRRHSSHSLPEDVRAGTPSSPMRHAASSGHINGTVATTGSQPAPHAAAATAAATAAPAASVTAAAPTVAVHKPRANDAPPPTGSAVHHANHRDGLEGRAVYQGHSHHQRQQYQPRHQRQTPQPHAHQQLHQGGPSAHSPSDEAQTVSQLSPQPPRVESPHTLRVDTSVGVPSHVFASRRRPPSAARSRPGSAVSRPGSASQRTTSPLSRGGQERVAYVPASLTQPRSVYRPPSGPPRRPPRNAAPRSPSPPVARSPAYGLAAKRSEPRLEASPVATVESGSYEETSVVVSSDTSSSGQECVNTSGSGSQASDSYDMDDFIMDLDDDEPVPRALSPSGFEEFVSAERARGVQQGGGGYRGW